MDMADVQRDLNGFGRRVNDVEVEQARIGVKIERNEQDIAKLFSLVESNAQTINKVEQSLATLTGKIAGVVALASVLVSILFKVGEMLLR